MSLRLVKYDAARQALAEAHRVDEVKDIRDKAVALAAYARQAKDSDMITWATEIKVRAERKVGQLLRETAETGQRRTSADGRPRKEAWVDTDALPTLKKIGISREQSQNWQKLAAIPEPEFELRIRDAKGNPAAMTTEKIIRPAPPVKPIPFADEVRVWAGVSEWLRGARELPELDALKSVQPKGGVRTALREHFLVAEEYLVMLKRLHTEDWL